MKKNISVIASSVLAVIAVFSTMPAHGGEGEISDTYKWCANLRIPKVIDNTGSMGKRKYVTQKLRGEMVVRWSAEGLEGIEFRNMVNRSHKIGGVPITYQCEVGDYTVEKRFVWVGNNKTSEFKTPALTAYVQAIPSYSVAEDPQEDDSLWFLMSGKGASVKNGGGCRVAKSLSGKIAGQIGCGCSAYGHTSPTRVGSICGADLCTVTDVAPVYGSWSARLVSAGCRSCIAILR